jgi:hypothetical protein
MEPKHGAANRKRKVLILDTSAFRAERDGRVAAEIDGILAQLARTIRRTPTEGLGSGIVITFPAKNIS